jgi:hypothetical protein
MIIRTLAASALASTLIFSANLALAADQIKDQTKTQDQTQDQIFGSQLMTEQERLEHRNKMRSLKTETEREAFQLEHHKLMQARAKEKGVTLPEQPMRPGGMHPGGGMGSGMGPGGRY